MSFTDAIADVAAAGFAAFGESGTYTPAGGSATAATFIPSAPDNVIGLGSIGAIVPDVTADVLVSEWAAPARGDAVTVRGINYTVSTVQRDASGTIWKLGLNEV